MYKMKYSSTTERERVVDKKRELPDITVYVYIDKALLILSVFSLTTLV